MSKKKYFIVCLIAVTLLLYLKNTETGSTIPGEDRCYAVSQIWAMSSKYYGFWELTNSDLDWDLEYQNAYAKVRNIVNAQ